MRGTAGRYRPLRNGGMKSSASRRRCLFPIPLVRHLLHPVDDLLVKMFLNDDVPHGRRERCSSSVLFVRHKPDKVSGPYLLDRAAVSLHEAKSTVTTSV